MKLLDQARRSSALDRQRRVARRDRRIVDRTTSSRDAVREAALFQAQDRRRAARADLGAGASSIDMPLEDDSFTIRTRGASRSIVEGAYTRPIEVVPGFEYPWRFDWAIDGVRDRAAQARRDRHLAADAGSAPAPAPPRRRRSADAAGLPSLSAWPRAMEQDPCPRARALPVRGRTRACCAASGSSPRSSSRRPCA